ncbi:MAG: CpsD/CapB family tyrosine-protein kinase [Coprococcus sp.]
MEKKSANHDKKPNICEKLNFAASEANNLLMTNIGLSFADDETCHSIGITSAMSGAGKSVTSINLAYTISKHNKKVLLIEGDLRKPSFGYYLNEKRSKGLSNFLTGQCGLEKVIARKFLGEYGDVIFSGDIPPNPSELLSSDKMRKLIIDMKKEYSSIIIDLSPVYVVSDAIVLSSAIDGMIMVVRHEVTDKTLLSKSMAQLKFADVKMLGFVYNDFQIENHYYKKGKKYAEYSEA